MNVHTVGGEIASDELGVTLTHEHVSTADWSMRSAFEDRFYQRDVVTERAVLQFSQAREAGVRTVVDGTPINMGRDVGLIAEVAEQTGLNFVLSSGFYFHEESYLQWRSEDEIHDFLSRECAEGVGSTGIRPAS